MQNRKAYAGLLIGSILAAALSGCGRQSKAETIVEEFLDENLKESDYSTQFADIDSTMHLSDSMVYVLKASAEKNKRYKSPIKYGKGDKNDKYIFMKAVIVIGDNDTVHQTFYLDPGLTHVIAFKEN